MRTRFPAYIVGIYLMMDPEEAVGVNTRNDECVESKQVYVCFWDWVYMAGPFSNSDRGFMGVLITGFTLAVQVPFYAEIRCGCDCVLSNGLLYSYYFLVCKFSFVLSEFTQIQLVWLGEYITTVPKTGRDFLTCINLLVFRS